MAQKSTSIYAQVVEQATHKTVLRKTFFNSKGYNEWANSEEIITKYPKPTFYLVKETY